MCEEFSGRIVAISGFRNEDIADKDYLMFLKQAHKYNCRLHALGMTRRKILDVVPFDYCDSSSWAQAIIYARMYTESGKTVKVDSEWVRDAKNLDKLSLRNYRYGMKLQKIYYEKWRDYDEDFGGVGWNKIFGER